MTGAAVRPSREEFRALARDYTVVPVWREVLADFETPLSAFVKLVGDREGFLLESVEHAERWGRFSFLGRDPARTFVARGRSIEWFGGSPPDGVPDDQGTLAVLEALLERFRAPTLPELPPFHGGIVGWMGYDTVREIEHLPSPPPDDLGFPDAVCSLAGSVAAFDHFRQRLYLIENVYPPPGADEADGRRDVRRRDRAARRTRSSISANRCRTCRRSPPGDDLDELPEIRRNFSREAWADAVNAAKEHILEGDIFQVVLAQRFDLVEPVTPLDVYRVLRLVNPSPYMYYLHHPEATVVGSSPEALVQLRDGRVISRPIAGTRRRGRNEDHDRRLEAELVEHPKERAEHVMLVDLARNDVGRVVRYGSEQVEELMTLERYSHVMHLTSQVAGDLAEGKGPIDVLRGDLPGRHRQRRAEGAGDGDHRRARTDQTRAVRGCGRLRRLLRKPRHRDRDPDDVLAGRSGDAAGGGGHRGRFGARGRRPGMPEQGPGVAHCSGRRPASPRRIMTDSFQARSNVISWSSRAPTPRRSCRASSPRTSTRSRSASRRTRCCCSPRASCSSTSTSCTSSPTTWWCVCERGFGAELASGLNRFKIRVKAEVTEVPVAALAVRGVAGAGAGGRSRDVQIVAVDWPGGEVVRRVGPDDVDRSGARAWSTRPSSMRTHTNGRASRRACPRQGLDTDDRTIPQEAGLERSRCRSRRAASSARSSCAASTPAVT